MVQMLVKIKDDSMCFKEWALIEVQGDLECNSESSVGGKMIGRLIFTTKGRVALVIGFCIFYDENDPSVLILPEGKDLGVHWISISNYKHRTLAEYLILPSLKKRIVRSAWLKSKVKERCIMMILIITLTINEICVLRNLCMVPQDHLVDHQGLT